MVLPENEPVVSESSVSDSASGSEAAVARKYSGRVRPSRLPGNAEQGGGAPVQKPDLEEAVNQASAAIAQEAASAKRPQLSVERARARGEKAKLNPVVLRTENLTKLYGTHAAANEVSLEVRAGSFLGFVGPNGAGKTTTLSMISGLLRPSSGKVFVHDVDVWGDGQAAKSMIGTLPDRLRLFDRLTGAELMHYSGVLQRVEPELLARRSALLAESFGLESALPRLVANYSAGMRKKIALACAMLHSPDVLVLDEPFEAIDPVSAANVTEILEKYVAGGGSVIMSSHNLDLIQRVCDHVAIIVDGRIIAKGTVDEVRDGKTLEARFARLAGAGSDGEGLEWLRSSFASE